MVEGTDKYARLAARLLIAQGAEQATERADSRRDTVVAALALAMAEKVRRRRIVIAIGVGLAAAASVALGVRFAATGGLVAERGGAAMLVVEHSSGSGNLLVHAGVVQPLPDQSALTVGDGIRSDKDGNATIAFKNQTRMTISPASDLRVVELGATRRFMLLGGRVQSHVAKLAQGERFIVNTPDSEVEVRGTVFSVEVGAPSPGCRSSGVVSMVSVSEGVVSVLSRDTRVLVRPGETWTVPCDGAPVTSTHPAKADAAGAAAVVPAGRPSSTAGSFRPAARKPAQPRTGRGPAAAAPVDELPLAVPARESPAAEPPTSLLAEQNDLFSAAMAAEREARHDLALGKLNELIARFPSGPLGESARAERQRILSSSGQRQGPASKSDSR